VTGLGRFAPSPTGPLHFGSLVAAVASWVDARSRGARWIVRIEDVDETRTVPGASEEILATLAALGMVSDGEVAWQSRRKALYDAALARLAEAGHLYRCRCSRREIADSGLLGPEGAIYPGTCRGLALEEGAVRLRVPPGDVAFTDELRGTLTQDVAAAIGDFVLRRRDGLHAYQLAVVVDDADQGVTDVVRGADLLWSTPRQVLLQRLLGLATPRYLHVPVATNAAGEKLSKQTRAAPVDPSRPREAIAAALDFLGQASAPAATPAAMLEAAAARWRPWDIPAGGPFV
jgi:glutamyl-Q tRNA(Asp) synthetase